MNKRIVLMNYPVLFGTVLVILLCIAGLFLSGIYGNPNSLLIQLANTALGILPVFCVFDLWYLFRAGIVVKDDYAVTGKDPGGMPEGFEVKELQSIRLLLPDGSEDDGQHLLYPHAKIEFCLRDGHRRLYDAHMLTRGQYRRVRRAFGK